MLDGDAHQLGERAHAEFGLELRAGVGHGLVAHVQILGDHSVGLAFGDQRKRLQLAPSCAARDWSFPSPP